MKVVISLIFSVILLTISFSNSVEADNGVYIPDHEYTGFFDNNGIYTVIAGIKNQENFAVVPTLTVSVNDGNKVFSSDYEFSSIMPHQMLPMKIKLPEITSENPILEPPIITYTESENMFPGGYVIYDDTLVIHDDASLTGKIRNGGEEIFENFRVYALIKDKNDISLTVVGEEKNVTNTINQNNVFVKKNENNKENLIKFYDDHNIFILPSFTEGHPMALLEALARRRPVIVFDEIKHVIGNKKGIFVASRNFESLSKTINEIKENYQSIQEEMKQNNLPKHKEFIGQMGDIISKLN